MASVGKNILFNVLHKVVHALFPLVTTVYVSHILLAGGVGKVSVAQNIAQYFVFLAPLGILNYGTREIAKARDNAVQTNKLFSELFCINAISTLLCSAFYYIMVFNGAYFAQEKTLFAIAGLAIVFNIINVDWYYQGKEKYVYISIRSIVVKIVSLILILLLVKDSSDYIIYAAIYIIGIAGNYIFNVVNLVREKVRLHLRGLNLKCHLSALLVLLCSSLAIELYTLIATTMLGYMCDDEIVGYFDSASKLNRFVVGFISAVGAVLLPRFSYFIKHNQRDTCNLLLSKIVMIMLFLAIPCGVAMLLLAEPIVSVMFGASFIPAIPTVRIGTILIYILAFNNLFGTQVLLSFGQERKLLMATCVGAAINIMLNLVLIPLLAHNGSIIAAVASEMAVFVLTVIYSLRHVSIAIPLRFWMLTLLSVVMMATSVVATRNNITNDHWMLPIATVAGICIYFLSAKVLGNPVYSIVKSLKE